jgi:hypothetical protein
MLQNGARQKYILIFKEKIRQRALVNISAKKTSFDKRENDF